MEVGAGLLILDQMAERLQPGAVVDIWSAAHFVVRMARLAACEGGARPEAA